MKGEVETFRLEARGHAGTVEIEVGAGEAADLIGGGRRRGGSGEEFLQIHIEAVDVGRCGEGRAGGGEQSGILVPLKGTDVRGVAELFDLIVGGAISAETAAGCSRW